MRIDMNDLRGVEEAVATNARVFLDGVEQKLCYLADEQRGVVGRYVLPVLGEGHADDELKREIVRGSVRIELRDGADRWLHDAYRQLREAQAATLTSIVPATA